jgi:hypothetical protein
MEEEHADKRPLALLTFDELGFYFGINPEQLTAVELLGKDSSEFFNRFDEAKIEGKIVKFQNIEAQRFSCQYTTQFHAGFMELDENREFKFFEIELDGIFSIKKDNSTYILMRDEERGMFWQSVKDGKKRTPVDKSIIFLCRPEQRKTQTAT